MRQRFLCGGPVVMLYPLKPICSDGKSLRIPYVPCAQIKRRLRVISYGVALQRRFYGVGVRVGFRSGAVSTRISDYSQRFSSSFGPG
ncbi:hypothetical protein SLA2020_285040 [Shorea laevis]